MLILTHAWLNLWDKHMTTGRINQVTTDCDRATWRRSRSNPRAFLNRHHTLHRVVFVNVFPVKRQESSLRRLVRPSEFPLSRQFSFLFPHSNEHYKRTLTAVSHERNFSEHSHCELSYRALIDAFFHQSLTVKLSYRSKLQTLWRPCRVSRLIPTRSTLIDCLRFKRL